MQFAADGPGELLLGDSVANDSVDTVGHAKEFDLSPGSNFVLDEAAAFSGHFDRVLATIMLDSSAAVAELDVHMLSDARQSPGNCFVFGTATLGV